MNSDPQTLRIEHSTAYSSITLRTCAMSSCPSPSCAIAASIMPTVRYAMASPVKIPAAMLASFSRINPKSAITFPNALRCLAYAIAPSMQLRAEPTHAAPSLNRPTLRTLKAMWCPLPISPRTFSAGTSQSFRIRGQVEEPRIPILCSSAPTENPGNFRSTIKAVNRSPSALANTMNRPANPAFVIHIFSPFRM